MTFAIRNASIDDAEQMIALDRALAEDGRGMAVLPDQINSIDDERQSIEKMHKSIADGTATLPILAEVDGRIVGSALLRQESAGRLRHVGVLSLGVHPDFQRRGIGRALMQHLIDHARAHQLVRLELYVRADNARAQALYLSLGFTHEGTRARLIRLDDGTFVDDFTFSMFLPEGLH